MPDLNNPDLAPVSFVKGGLYLGQVHMAGTFAYVPAELAEYDSARQRKEFGEVYYMPGIVPGNVSGAMPITV